MLDLCPTILSLYGLPVGRDMDGKPLVTIFEEPTEVATIESWEDVPGKSDMHPPDAMLDSVQSAEAMKQLVELGYIEEPNEDTDVAVKETVRELRYNLAQSFMDAWRLAEAAEILEEIWNDYPDEHRFGLNLLGCLAGLERWSDHAAATAKLATNVVASREKALEELEKLRPEAEKHDLKIPKFRKEGEQVAVDEAEEAAEDEKNAEGAEAEGEPKAEDKPYKEPPRPLVFKIRKLMSLLGDMRGTFAWLETQHAIGTGAGEKALPMLEAAFAECAKDETPDRNLMLAHAFLRLGSREKADACFARALEADSENADARLGLAECAVAREAWDDAIEHALSATELRFQNPRAHHLLGKALHASGDHATAKAAIELAVAQAPAYAEARESLAALLEALGDSEGAAHQRRFVEELAKRADPSTDLPGDELDAAMASIAEDRAKRREGADWLGSFGDVPREEIVTIVSGLPRSGTSMMMQAIAAGGLAAFTDEKREADSDNPRGYYEHEKATQLARDASWIPEAKGKAVKIVAQLLSFLPRGPQTQKYRVVFMDRDLREIVTSQRAMLDRLGKSGGKLEPAKMMKTLDAQVAQIERWMRQRPDVECLFVDYAKVLADPRTEMAKVAAFLGGADAEAMATAIDPSLRRQRGGEPT